MINLDPRAGACRAEAAGLRAIARTRALGLHVLGHLPGCGVEGVARDGRARFRLEAEPAPAPGSAPPSVVGVAVLADLALGAAAWTGLGGRDRTATTQLTLQVWRWPARAPVHAAAALVAASGPRVATRATLTAGGRRVGQAVGGFRRQPGPPGGKPSGLWSGAEPAVPPLAVEDLQPRERTVLDTIRAAGASATLEEPLSVRLLGLAWQVRGDEAEARLVPGPHLSNVAGHVQGGVLAACLALGGRMATGCGAEAPLELAVQYLRPGVGRELRVHARVERRGQTTAAGVARIVCEDDGEVVALGQWAYGTAEARASARS